MSEWVLPEDASVQLLSLADSDIHLLVCSLSWEKFLFPNLLATDSIALARIFDEQKKTTWTEFLLCLPPVRGAAFSEKLIAIICTFLTQLEDSPSDLNGVIEDVRGVWYARSDDLASRIAVDATFDLLFIRKQSLETLRQLGYVLDDLSLRCDEF